jgi:hypothetical protein
MVVYNIDSESLYSASSSGGSEDADSISLSESGDDEGNSTGDLTDKSNRNAAAISEIEALARNDTQMLRAWRIAVLSIIVATFVAVTTGTCVFIKKQQESNVDDSVSTLHWCCYRPCKTLSYLYFSICIVLPICAHGAGFHRSSVS